VRETPQSLILPTDDSLLLKIAEKIALNFNVLHRIPPSVHKVFKIDHSVHWFWGHYLSAMKKELSPKQILAVRCPTCGAAPKAKCKLGSGQPRTKPHRDRRSIAKD
jgi:hypothetical protein